MFTLCERPRIRKLLQLMLAALLATTTCLNTLLLSPQRAYAEDADIGSVGYLSYVGPLLEDKPNKNPSGTVALSNHMEITVGNTVLVAICSEHELDTPPLGTAVRKTGTITNDDIRRILYYGYKGPEDQGYSVVRTATAVSLANGHMQTSLAQSMIDAVRKLPAPPSNWVVEMWNTDGAGDQNLVTGRLVRQVGWIEIQKKSSNESITEHSACYSLENAVYGVYLTKTDAAARQNAVTELRTNTAGYAKSGTLDTGTYFVRETVAPEGMSLSDAVYPVTVSHNAVARVNAENDGLVTDDPLTVRPAPLLQKSDAERLATPGEPQGQATLAGSIWTAEFYFGYFTSVEDARSSGKAPRVWKFVTDEQGIIKLDPAYLAEGSDELWLEDGQAVLPLGTIVWEEERAPEGYLNTARKHAEASGGTYPFLRTITADGGYSAVDAADDVVRGGVRVQKTDAENGTSTALGAAEIDGARIDIVSDNPNPVLVGGILYEQGQVVATLSIVDGWAETAVDALPYGRYILSESMPGYGYELSTVQRTFEIRIDGSIVEMAGSKSMPNQVKRGDVSFIKTSGDSPVSNVAFRITSATTGESHIIVTDQNGIASTAANHTAHTSGTNANDAANVGAYNPLAGVWFGRTAEGGNTLPNDSLGALPFDTYTLEELVCPANEGLQLADPVTFTIAQHGVTVDLGEIDNPKGTISTYATDNTDGDKIIHADDQAVLVDAVTYSNLIPGRTYALEGYLVNVSTGEPVWQDGERIVSSTTFVPEAAHGTVSMSYTFDGYLLGECDIAPFVELSSAGRTLAEHKDAADTQQIVHVAQPSISTFASAPDGVSKAVACDPEAAVVDTVTYANLIPGQTYTLEGRLISQATGEAVLNGTVPVTAATTFTAEAAEGTAVVQFVLNSLDHRGESFVVFETLKGDGRTLVQHADIDDEAQTVVVSVPVLSTLAIDALDADKIVNAHPDSIVHDLVTYENLVPGSEYVAKGYLLNADTSEPLRVDSNPVEACTTFTPEHSSGTVEVAFAFDTTPFAGQRIVAMESVERLGQVVAEHLDPESESQTIAVSLPTLDTMARDTLDGDALVLAERGAVIRDSVMYEGLNPGMEYTLETTVYDTETKKLLEASGKTITIVTTFVPDESMGALDVDVAFDTTDLAGTALVVFQTLKADDVIVATHADPLDVDQTVGIILPADPGLFDKTGDSNLVALAITLTLVIAGATAAIILGTHWGERTSKKSLKDHMISRL